MNRYSGRKRYYNPGKPYSGYQYKKYQPMASKYKKSRAGQTRFSSAYTNRFVNKSTILKAANVELKFHDTTPDTNGNFNILPPDNQHPDRVAGYTHNLNLIKIGPGPSERIGRKITVKSIMANLEFTMDAHQSDFIRCSIVLDKQSNGQTAAISDIYTGTVPWDFTNVYNNKRFQVLYSKTFALNWAGIANENNDWANGETRKYVGIKLKTNIPIDYSDVVADANINQLKSNNLVLVITGAEGKTKVKGKTRILFTDY